MGTWLIVLQLCHTCVSFMARTVFLIPVDDTCYYRKTLTIQFKASYLSLMDDKTDELR